MPLIDPDSLPVRTGTIYPPPLDREVAGRSSIRLGQAGGLTQFGVNIVILAPGAKSSIRHWHENEDEFVMALEGELTLVTDAGETPLPPGQCAAFPAGDPDAHHLINRSDAEARFLVIGSKAAREVAHYPDYGLKVAIADGSVAFTHADGRPYDGEPPETPRTKG
ncbi:cupin domain-containing protein [Psychromarinibacter sp. C21-152]|uniref:Cupin domain-containing protein n=1 Tax=Psychromarinibacter sediminicola TaxID=3033385 RepID=A0AAE3NSY9_9RHOB|nr:cupin domain-containing protein [Psychromarinibacter sediminicola]MDF0600360.1 cupin domain-containing protein [Psychromarinibacter sediminicola]